VLEEILGEGDICGAKEERSYTSFRMTDFG